MSLMRRGRGLARRYGRGAVRYGHATAGAVEDGLKKAVDKTGEFVREHPAAVTGAAIGAVAGAVGAAPGAVIGAVAGAVVDAKVK